MVPVRFSPINDWTLDHVRDAETAELTAQNSRRVRDRSAKRTAHRSKAPNAKPARKKAFAFGVLFRCACGRRSRPPVARVFSARSCSSSVCRPKGGQCKKHLRVLRVLRGEAFESRAARKGGPQRDTQSHDA